MDDVENYKEDNVVEKDDLIKKKDSEHKEIRRKKKIWKILVLSMRESSEKAMEVNIEPRLNVDEQQDEKNI